MGYCSTKEKNEKNSLHTQVGSFNIYIENTIFIIDQYHAESHFSQMSFNFYLFPKHHSNITIHPSGTHLQKNEIKNI